MFCWKVKMSIYKKRMLKWKSYNETEDFIKGLRIIQYLYNKLNNNLYNYTKYNNLYNTFFSSFLPLSIISLISFYIFLPSVPVSLLYKLFYIFVVIIQFLTVERDIISGFLRTNCLSFVFCFPPTTVVFLR